MPIRDDFPLAGNNYQDGESDGYTYRLSFNGLSLANSYQMIQAFLEEEGYENIPLPKDIEELNCFRHPTTVGSPQIRLFEDNGYCHYPIKILFPLDRRKKKQLTLIIYNEQAENQLLRFHHLLDRKYETTNQ